MPILWLAANLGTKFCFCHTVGVPRSLACPGAAHSLSHHAQEDRGMSQASPANPQPGQVGSLAALGTCPRSGRNGAPKVQPILPPGPPRAPDYCLSFFRSPD